MRTEGKQAPCLGSQVIKPWGSWNDKWLLLLFVTCWRLWETERIFLKVLGIRRTRKGRWGRGKGEKGRVHGSGFPNNVRYTPVPVSWQVGSVAEGQMAGVRAESGAEDHPPPSGCRKAPQTAWRATAVCYSGRHQKAAQGKSCLSPVVSWPISSVSPGKTRVAFCSRSVQKAA